MPLVSFNGVGGTVGVGGNYTYLLVVNQINTPIAGQITHTCYGWMSPNFIPIGSGSIVSGNVIGNFLGGGAIVVDDRESGNAFPGPRFPSWDIPSFPTLPRVAVAIGLDTVLDLDHDNNTYNTASGGAVQADGWYLIRWVGNGFGNGALLLAKDGVYYNGNSQYNVESQVKSALLPFVPCIHPDMIVDELGISISQVSQFGSDGEYLDNLKLGRTAKFVNIRKGALGGDKPTQDLLLTAEHPIVHEGKEIIAENLVNGETIVWVELDYPVTVYTLEFATRKTVKMHGVDVVQWGKDDFEKFQRDNRIKYIGCGFMKTVDVPAKTDKRKRKYILSNRRK
jgi:hypothetical protein